jgi:iron complex outermembrane receptor protein
LIAEGCNQLYDAATGAYTAQNLSGRPLVRAPDVTVVPSADYEHPIGQGMKVVLGAFVTYTSAYYTALIDRTAPGYLQGGFAKTNLSFALKGPNDNWEVALIGNNITDRITAGHCDNAEEQGAVIFGGEVAGTNKYGPGGDDYPTCTPERGREVWVRFTVRPLGFF